MDKKEDDPDIDNAGFANFGPATFGHAPAPTLDNDGSDDGDGVDHGNGTGDGTGDGTDNGIGDGNDRATYVRNPAHSIDNDFFFIKDNVLGIPTNDEATRSSVRSSKRSSKEPTRFADDDDEVDHGPESQYVDILLEAYKNSPLTELAERAQHMVNDRSVFMNVANIVQGNEAKLDGAFNLVDASSDDFQGDFSSQFVVATKLSVMNGGARKSLQDINSKFFPDTRKDAFIKSSPRLRNCSSR